MEFKFTVKESSDMDSPPAVFSFPMPFALFPTLTRYHIFQCFYRKVEIDYEEH